MFVREEGKKMRGEGRGKWNERKEKEKKGKERKGKRFPRFLSKENSSKENRKVRGNVRAYLNEGEVGYT